MRAVFGESFYIVYFQNVGPAETEMGKDVRANDDPNVVGRVGRLRTSARGRCGGGQHGSRWVPGIDAHDA